MYKKTFLVVIKQNGMIKVTFILEGISHFPEAKIELLHGLYIMYIYVCKYASPPPLPNLTSSLYADIIYCQCKKTQHVCNFEKCTHIHLHISNQSYPLRYLPDE